MDPSSSSPARIFLIRRRSVVFCKKNRIFPVCSHGRKMSRRMLETPGNSVSSIPAYDFSTGRLTVYTNKKTEHTKLQNYPQKNCIKTPSREGKFVNVVHLSLEVKEENPASSPGPAAAG